MKKIIVFVILLFLLSASVDIPEFMICRYWSWEKNDWKVVRCLKSEDMSKKYVPTYTSTEYVDPTDVFTPEPTIQETLTVEPYPEPEITWTPEPYPKPTLSLDWLDWWKRR